MANLTYFISIAIIIATPITGIILLLDRFFWQKNRTDQDKLPALVDWSKFLFPVVLFVSVLRSFIAEPYIIPSGSMQPTLYEGDMIVANKWSFGLRYPITNKRIFSERGEGIERGDVAIFKYPKDERINYVKRIVGVPGDKIDYRNKRLTINDVPLEYEKLGPARDPEEDLFIRETMPSKEGTIDYTIQNSRYLTDADFFVAAQFPIIIPEGKYLAMGDNRDNSADSRFWGFVDDDQMLAKANFIWMNYKCLFKFKDCDRIFTTIK